MFSGRAPACNLNVTSRNFGKDRRLRRRGEFQRVFDSGGRVRSRFFTLVVARHEGTASRLGIVASRKLGDAVRRNRAKRLIRELFRRADLASQPALDIVVIPRSELFQAAYVSLEDDFRSALARAAKLKHSVPARPAIHERS